MSSVPFERRSFAGGASASTLANAITTTDLSIPLTIATGWPDGTVGPYYAVIGRGLSNEEKIRITSLSGTNATIADISDRGVDGTARQAHAAGETVEVCMVAVDMDEANQTAVAMIGTILAKGDMAVGTAANTTATMSVGGDGEFLIADSSQTTGMMYGPIPNGAIYSAGMFASTPVDATVIADSAVTTAKIAASAVTTAKIADAGITIAKLDTGVAGSGLAGGAGTALHVTVDTTTLTINGFNVVTVGTISNTNLPTGYKLSPTGLYANGTVASANLASGWNVFALTEVNDPANWHTGTDGFVTLPQAGLYVASVKGKFNASAHWYGCGFNLGTTFSTGATDPNHDNDLRPSDGVHQARITTTEVFVAAANDKWTPAFYCDAAVTSGLVSATWAIAWLGYTS